MVEKKKSKCPRKRNLQPGFFCLSALKRKLMLRRSVIELVDQGIYPRKQLTSLSTVDTSLLGSGGWGIVLPISPLANRGGPRSGVGGVGGLSGTVCQGGNHPRILTIFFTPGISVLGPVKERWSASPCWSYLVGLHLSSLCLV